ncbi:ATP-dependent helicase [Ectobacillus antri]|uniref:DNA 3'-5' helicase n=1 Tax=Ectobacillus antri TaxID=2486280 RepID=A0ABT6H7P7_9BACI|nr:ATP-dependent helicase [Ectobacillus antri]MDG4658202.1 ATP-dependent helicase [Ectobacillus antri]MDG5755278.1 ATP-dependent helicase [Ectobacillus antri]
MNYSILLFYPEINREIENKIKSYLQHGIKVYAYTFDDIESWKDDPELGLALCKGFLRADTTRYDSQWDGETVHIYDGQVERHDEILSFLDKYSSFNKEQYILEHTGTLSHSIVKAGAGTGKTTTMINRLMYLRHMDETLRFSEMVMITFTNEAAIHMRTKVIEALRDYYELTKDSKYLLWTEEVGSMFIGTIHGFARVFLVTEGERFGFHSGMDVRGYKHERKKLIEKHVDRFANMYPSDYEPFRKVPHYQLTYALSQVIEKIYNKSISLDKVIGMDFGTDDTRFHFLAKHVVVDVLRELEQIKRMDSALEISDLISTLPSVYGRLKELKMPVRYMFVDEFQDSDEVQVSFVSWLAPAYACQLFAVGDIKQSIYRFRGADYTAFQQLQEQLEEKGQTVRQFALQKNYRSSRKLLGQFNALFHKWKERVPSFQFTSQDELIAGLADDHREGIQTVSMEKTNLKYLLQRLHKEDTAVLVRSNRDVQEMVQNIEKSGFFCEAEIAGSFFRSLPVREFYILIRRLTHPRVAKERFAFHQTVYGENTVTVSELLRAFTYEENFALKLLADHDSLNAERLKEISAIQFLEETIRRCKPHEVHAKRLYRTMRQEFPEQDKMMQQEEVRLQMREYEMNLEYLLYLLKKQFGDFQASLYDLEHYLAFKMATDTEETALKIEQPISHRIKVMTVHKAKGLEFDYVLLPLVQSPFIRAGGTELLLLHEAQKWKLGYRIKWKDKQSVNSIYESSIKDENAETIAEETRLLYVALTRAKKAVYADTSATMKEYGRVECWSDLLEDGERLAVSSAVLPKY